MQAHSSANGPICGIKGQVKTRDKKIEKEEITVSLEIIFKTITISFSFISLVISFLVAWSNRKTLHVEMYKDLEVIEGGSVFIIDDDGTPEPYGDALLAKIEIVNPSPKDIAFFDLRCFYPETNMNVSLLTRRTMLDQFKDKTLLRAIEKSKDNVDLIELIIPEKNYGVLKSGSFTKFDILMFPKTDAKELLLSFKVAKRSIIKDPFAVTGRKKFKHHGVAYNIHSWAESLSKSTSANS